MVFVEQNVERALRLTDRGYVLESCRTILHGPSAALLQSAEVRRVFLGDAAGSPAMLDPSAERSAAPEERERRRRRSND